MGTDEGKKSDMREICFDTETSGLHPEIDDRIISIGAVEIIDGKITDKTFYKVIDPERKISSTITSITGFINKDLKGKPKFAEIYDELIEFFGDSPLIGYNVNFDKKFLDREFALAGKKPLKNKFIDAYEDAKKVIKEFGKGKQTLDAIAKHYEVDLKEREIFHGALVDSKILAEVYIRLVKEPNVIAYHERFDKKEEEIEKPRQKKVKIEVIEDNKDFEEGNDAEVAIKQGVEMGDYALSKSQKLAFDKIKEGKNVFITGPAGTGKSYLLNCLKKEYKNLHITASTGIAAVNVGGFTIHSWAGLMTGDMPIEAILKIILGYGGKATKQRILNAEILAIDEVSMISDQLFNLLNQVLQTIRRNDAPFGGIQLVLFGDFLQLPPVKCPNFCFESEAWEKGNIEYVELCDIFRQTDKRLIDMLNHLRYGELSEEDIALLRYCYQRKDIDIEFEPTILGTHNMQVDSINNAKLAKLKTEKKTYKGSFKGKENKILDLKKNCIAKEELSIKVDSQVMMLKNSYGEKGIMNGSLGIVQSFSKSGFPMVKFTNGEIIEITPEEWSIEKFNHDTGEVEIEASMMQVPLLLAWAITVHKSQGMTLEKIKCDLGRAFTDGQIYVAVSRVKSLDGLYIESFDRNKIRANKKVIEFYKRIKK
ncbi:MAG: hypothetical protein Ta2D_10850 [Rickettsiales bacterium]|nr:MAG: hypothetical protein Ta2D_10850 [Rickettsiales bacterium]